MPTSKDYILALFNIRDNLKSTLENKSMDTTDINKYNYLVPLIGLIETGTGYSHATIIANRVQTLTISGFNFIPSSFAIVSEYALEHTYSVAGTAYNVVGSLQLDGLQLGQQAHSTELMIGDTLATITISTNLTVNLGIATMTVTLPSGYYFMGECEWAVLGSTAWDDYDEEDEEL